MNEIRYSAKRNRTYTRKFDHDLARKMFAEGMSKRAIARQLGVSRFAILLAKPVFEEGK